MCRVLPGRKSAVGSLHNCGNKLKGNLYDTNETIIAGDAIIYFLCVSCCVYVAFVTAVLSITRKDYDILFFLANHSYVWGLVLHGEMRRGCGRIRGIIDLVIPFHFIFLICVKRGRPIVCHFLRFMGYGVMHFFRVIHMLFE